MGLLSTWRQSYLDDTGWFRKGQFTPKQQINDLRSNSAQNYVKQITSQPIQTNISTPTIQAPQLNLPNITQNYVAQSAQLKNPSPKVPKIVKAVDFVSDIGEGMYGEWKNPSIDPFNQTPYQPQTLGQKIGAFPLQMLGAERTFQTPGFEENFNAVLQTNIPLAKLNQKVSNVSQAAKQQFNNIIQQFNLKINPIVDSLKGNPFTIKDLRDVTTNKGTPEQIQRFTNLKAQYGDDFVKFVKDSTKFENSNKTLFDWLSTVRTRLSYVAPQTTTTTQSVGLNAGNIVKPLVTNAKTGITSYNPISPIKPFVNTALNAAKTTFSNPALISQAQKITKQAPTRIYETGENPFITPKQRIQNILFYEPELRSRGFAPSQIKALSAKDAGVIIDHNLTSQQWEIAKKNAKASGFDPIDRLLFLDELKATGKDPKLIGNKTAGLDFFRTPRTVFEKVGLTPEFEYVEKQWLKFKQEKPVELRKIEAWRSQVPTPESNQKIFRWLDGKNIQLNPVEKQVATEIKSYLSDWADKLDIPTDSRISDYITHLFPRDEKGVEFDYEIASLISNKVPKTVYDPFLQQRSGKPEYLEDTWKALEAYVKRAVRKYNLDPALTKMEKVSSALPLEVYDYIKGFTNKVNMRPGKIDTLVDNQIKQIPGVGYKLGQRPITKLSRSIRNTIYRGAIGLNPGTAIKNLTQVSNTFAELGTKYTTIGLYNAFTKRNSEELIKSGLYEDAFIQDRDIVAVKKLIQKMDDGLFKLFEESEKFNRRTAYFAGKAKALDAGKTEIEAMEYGRRIAIKTQFKFDAIESPVALSMGGDTASLFTQFQTFGLKQLEFLSDKFTRREWAGLLRWLALTIFFYKTFGEVLGWDFWDMIFPNPFGQSPLIKAATNVKNSFSDDDYKKAQAQKELKSASWLLIPGGGQLRKSYEGYQAYKQGYSQSPKGLVRFPVEQTPMNGVRNTLFGQWSTPQAKEYVKNDFPILSEKQSQAVKTSTDKVQTYENIMETKGLNAAKEAIKKGEQPKVEYVESKDAPKTLGGKTVLYGRSIFADPSTTIKAIIHGQPIRKLENGTVILERQKYLFGDTDTNTQRDHKIPLSLGGSNDESNLEYLSNEQHQIKSKFDAYVLSEFKKGNLTKQQAQQKSLNWRSEVDYVPEDLKTEIVTDIKNTTKTKEVDSVVENMKSLFEYSSETSLKVKDNVYLYKTTTEAGNTSIKVADLNPIDKPTLSGYSELDKKRISNYNSAVSAQIKKVVELNELGILSNDEAETYLSKLKKTKTSTAKAKTKSAKKIGYKKISANKIKIKDFAKPKGLTIKIKPIPKIKIKAQKTLKNLIDRI